MVVPAPLRKFTAGKSEIETSGGTLREVLAHIEASHPGVANRVLDGDQVRSFLKVFIGAEDALHCGGLDAPVADGDTITILASLAGG